MASSKRPAPKVDAMDIILDFVFEQGLLFIELSNRSKDPVFDVKVRFRPGFTGQGGTKKMHALAVFKGIPFMAPGKSIRVFMDVSHAYFHRKDPTSIVANITYRRLDGKAMKYSIPHDLAIYADLTYLANPPNLS